MGVWFRRRQSAKSGWVPSLTLDLSRKRDRRMLGQFQEWYGTTWTCAGCGERWTDGEQHERPFVPGWRAEHIRHARAQLAQIGIAA